MENLIFTLGAGSFPVGFSETIPGLFAGSVGTSNLSLGLFHGFILSFPFSAPILICIYRFLVEGIIPGSLATAGTILGQICFFTFLLSSNRTFVQFWYTTEPFLAFLGFALAFKLATDFYNGSGANFSFGGMRNFNQMTPKWVGIFGLNFVLMFLNPAMPGSSTRILLATPSLANYGSSAGEFLAYNFGFITMSAVFIGIVWPIVFSVLIQVLNRGRAFASLAGEQVVARFQQNTDFSPKKLGSYDAVIQPRFLSFLIVGCLITGGFQYSWRLFTQYPLEALQFGQSAEYRTTAREFPSFDSNIRHRDKNLPVDRHVPIEKMNSRRTLSGRPPLSEEQKSDAYFKFNSFFVNNVEQKFENQLIRSRLGQTQREANQIRSYDEIDYLQKLKTQFESAANSGSPVLDIRPRSAENNTKGKPKFSYIRELISDSQDPSGSRLNPFLHDELQIYGALLN